MRIPHKLVLAGVALSIISIALGAVALATPEWLKLQLKIGDSVSPGGTYGLFSCSDRWCSELPGFRVAQGLLIAGVAAFAVGVFIALLLDVFTDKKWLPLLPQIFLFVGPTLILIGLVLYAKYVFDELGRRVPATLPQTSLNIGYSIILIIVACILGFLTAIFLAFAAGYRFRHIRDSERRMVAPVDVIHRNERF